MSQQNIVQIKMEDPNGVIPKLQALAKICPKECERAQLRAASIMPRKIVAAVRGLNVQGAGGKLPALSDLSRALRHQKPGGLLTSEKGLCRVMTSNGKLVVGFVGRVANVAELWQEGGTKPVSVSQRRRMHIILGKKGLSAIEVPMQSIQPQRLVVDPLAETFGREMPKWIFGALEKIIDKKLAGPKKK